MSDPVDIVVADGRIAVKGAGYGDDGSGDFAASIAKGSGVGVWGVSDVGIGVQGDSSTGSGIWGSSKQADGVVGQSDAGTGVLGSSATQRGVWGISDSFIATVGDSKTGTGVWGRSETGPGVVARSVSGQGLYAEGSPAGHFQGDVEVTGTITVDIDVVFRNGDVAEDFDVEQPGLEPGTVLCVGAEERLHPCAKGYDTRVVGVISGAGEFRPAIILNRDKGSPARVPVALTGRVTCKVDAGGGAIMPGDLLTTSATPGHAMRADGRQGLGAIIGKALGALPRGRGVIPILVALQ